MQLFRDGMLPVQFDAVVVILFHECRHHAGKFPASLFRSGDVDELRTRKRAEDLSPGPVHGADVLADELLVRIAEVPDILDFYLLL